MGFRVTDKVTVVRKVPLRVPNPKSNTYFINNILLEFLVEDLDTEEARFRALEDVPVQQAGEDDAAFGARKAAYDRMSRNFLRERLGDVIVGWPADSGLTDDEDKPLPYSEEAKAKFLRIPFVFEQLSTYYAGLRAGREGPKGN